MATKKKNKKDDKGKTFTSYASYTRLLIELKWCCFSFSRKGAKSRNPAFTDEV